MTESWGIPTDASDVIRQMQRRAMRQERRPAAKSMESLLGAGMAAMAVRIMDWDSLDTLLNGFYYSEPGAVNSPSTALSWTGQTIAKDDGSGMQQVWNTDGAQTLYWMRTYEPNSLGDGNVVFGDWKKFATPSGYVGEEEIDPPVMDTINDAAANAAAALADAEEALNFATTSNRVFRQPTAPTNPTGTYTLRINDTWFDDDDGLKPYYWDGDSWEPNVGAHLGAGNVSFTPGGLIAVDDLAATTFILDADDGSVTMTGALVVGGDIDGATITGGLIQTDAAVDTGIKMNTGGFAAYDTLGNPTFTITAATGAVSMLGALVAGGTITGAAITGGTLQTSSNSNTARVVISGVSNAKDILFYTGHPTIEGQPGTVGTISQFTLSAGDYLTLSLVGPKLVGGGSYINGGAVRPRLDLRDVTLGQLTGESRAELQADIIELDGIIESIKVGASANRTYVVHSASISLSTNGSGVATWTHNLGLGSLVYQVLITSRANGAQRVFTTTDKSANSVSWRVENASGATVNSASGITADVLVIG